MSLHVCDFILPSSFWQAFFAQKRFRRELREFSLIQFALIGVIRVKIFPFIRVIEFSGVCGKLCAQ
jgi:hypothetical protein